MIESSERAVNQHGCLVKDYVLGVSTVGAITDRLVFYGWPAAVAGNWF
jgi:hypothetical protein